LSPWTVLVEMPGWRSSDWDDLGGLVDLIEAEVGVLGASVMGPALEMPRHLRSPWWLGLFNWRQWRDERRFASGGPTSYVSVEGSSPVEAKAVATRAVASALTAAGVNSDVAVLMVQDELGRVIEEVRPSRA
jgi:hypothetical protein